VSQPAALQVGAALVCGLCLAGCAADLLPGELVIPGERAALEYRGEAGETLGAAVALLDDAVLAGAPGVGEARRLDTGERCLGQAQLGRWVWWQDGAGMAAHAPAGVFAVDGAEAELRWETPGALSFAAGSTDQGFVVAAATATSVELWDGDGVPLASLAHAGVTRLFVGSERVLMLACDGDCQAWAWDLGSAEAVSLGDAGAGGDIVEVGGVAWWGDPELERDLGAGRVCAEDGRCLEGLEGDHLGRRLSTTHAAGVYNTWIVPARLRLVPLDGGTVLAIDRAPASRAPALHSQGGRLAVGLPQDGLNSWGEGRVLVVELD